MLHRTPISVRACVIAVALLASACGDTHTELISRTQPESTVPPSPVEERAPTEAERETGESTPTAEPSVDRLQALDYSITTASEELVEIRGRASTVTFGIASTPYEEALKADVVVAGTAIDVHRGRTIVEPADPDQRLELLTLEIRVERSTIEDLVGTAIFVQVYLPDTSLEAARALVPAQIPILVMATDLSDYEPLPHEEVLNPLGGRASADQTLWGGLPGGLWLIDGGKAENPYLDLEQAGAGWEFLEEARGGDALKALFERASDPSTADSEPAAPICVDLSHLDTSLIDGIDDELRGELDRRIATDDCITNEEIAEFFAEHPELNDAVLRGE